MIAEIRRIFGPIVVEGTSDLDLLSNLLSSGFEKNYPGEKVPKKIVDRLFDVAEDVFESDHTTKSILPLRGDDEMLYAKVLLKIARFADEGFAETEKNDLADFLYNELGNKNPSINSGLINSGDAHFMLNLCSQDR